MWPYVDSKKQYDQTMYVNKHTHLTDSAKKEIVADLMKIEKGETLQATKAKSQNGLNLTPPQIGRIVADQTGMDVKYVHTRGPELSDGLEYHLVTVNVGQGRHILGSYGKKDQPEDRGFTVKKVGSDLEFKSNMKFDESNMDLDLEKEDLEELKNQTLEALENSSVEVHKRMIKQRKMNMLTEFTVGFNSKEPANWYKDETKETAEKIAEKYNIQKSDVYTEILKAIYTRRHVDFEFNYEIKIQ